jgi:hypothetical protein
MPSGRAFVKIRRELSRLREDLIEQYGGDKVSPQAVILIDSVIEALGVQKLQGLYIRKAGIIRQDSLEAGNLELHSILGKNWISYANVVRQGLMALRELGAPHEERGLTPAELAEAITLEAAEMASQGKETEECEKSPQDAKGGPPAQDPGDGS